MDKECTVIIPAAGKGTRMNSKICKPYLELKRKPILSHTLEKFEQCERIKHIILVVNKNDVTYCKKHIVDPYNVTKVLKIVSGGNERQESVYNGLLVVPESTDYVIIHDGARPFISVQAINKMIDKAEHYKACVMGVKVKDTIKVVDDQNFVSETPKRKMLWAVQTPQIFEADIIKEAYRRAQKEQYCGTDDAMLVEKYMNLKVKMIEGCYTNIKITTQEDLIIGHSFINQKMD